MRIKLLGLFLLSIILLPGCFSIKSDYPEIDYYTLSQEPSSLKGIEKIDASLMVRDFTVNQNLETDQILATWDDINVKRYYYSRWISDYSSIITDFFVSRYNTLNSFAGGVVRPSSIIVPDYILEGQVVDMMANNSTSSGKNNVSIKLRISLLKTVPMSTENIVVFNHLYTVDENRPDNTVKSVVPAYSRAMARIADLMYVDLIAAIASDRASRDKQTLDK